MKGLSDIKELYKEHKDEFQEQAKANNIGEIYGISKTYQETYEIIGTKGILVYNLETNQLIAVKTLIRV